MREWKMTDHDFCRGKKGKGEFNGKESDEEKKEKSEKSEKRQEKKSSF
jgi:hypothetical protein